MKCLIFGLLFWFAETAWFGWNWGREPSCDAEHVCDIIARVFVLIGLLKIIVASEVKAYFEPPKPKGK